MSTSTFSNPRSYYLDRGPRDLKQNNMRSSASKRTRFPNFHASSRAGNSANQTIFLLRKSSVCGRLLWLVASLFISFFVTRLLTKHVLTVYRGTAKKEISTDAWPSVPYTSIIETPEETENSMEETRMLLLSLQERLSALRQAKSKQQRQGEQEQERKPQELSQRLGLRASASESSLHSESLSVLPPVKDIATAEQYTGELSLPLSKQGAASEYRPDASIPEQHYNTMTTPLQENRRTKQVARPSWRVVTDCSPYHLDCTVHRRSYAPYPFDPTGRQGISHTWMKLDESASGNSTRVGSLPDEWQRVLVANKQGFGGFGPSIPEPYGATDSGPAPIPPDTAESRACLTDRRHVPFEQQLSKILPLPRDLDGTIDPHHEQSSQQSTGKRMRRTAFGMIAFAISDASYAVDMIDDVFAMAHKVVGFEGAFFLVALDLFTLTTVCRRGIHKHPTIAGPGVAESSTGHRRKLHATSKKEELLKLKVQNTKFVVAKALVDAGENFLFFEMVGNSPLVRYIVRPSFS